MKKFTRIIKEKYQQDTEFMKQMEDWGILNSMYLLTSEFNDEGIKFKIQKTLEEIEEANDK